MVADIDLQAIQPVAIASSPKKGCIRRDAFVHNAARMASKAKRRGKMGRPPSGNKAYLIRMKPDTHADLLHAAQKDGYQRLGEWLDSVPAEYLAKIANPARHEKPSEDLLNQAFCLFATEVTSALAEMRLIVERNPLLSEARSNCAAFDQLRQEFDALTRRMADFGLEM